MGVVINEFEAVTEAATPRDAAAGDAATGAKAKPPDAAEMVRLLRNVMQQAQRIWAH